jgi:hypothetical protein
MPRLAIASAKRAPLGGTGYSRFPITGRSADRARSNEPSFSAP